HGNITHARPAPILTGKNELIGFGFRFSPILKDGFGVLLFIPVKNYDRFGETRTLWVWVWERQNPSPPHCHVSIWGA
ncbi:hypothetical protein A2U01_0055313, partial [Trifolium medium]|nr:hypothetical protein [Trifolium medium]